MIITQLVFIIKVETKQIQINYIPFNYYASHNFYINDFCRRMVANNDFQNIRIYEMVINISVTVLNVNI